MSVLEKDIILNETYQILNEIGAGGGGVVYLAKHLRLQTDVVVKKIKDEVRDKVAIRQEADILKKLKHPYLPRVYDFIETSEGVYTVMDFIHGQNLDDALKSHGKYEQKDVQKWAEQLGEALAYLHSQNPPIIHSDIKPANIMLTDEGDICLIDFNISLAMGGTMESAVGISLGFSPPEQYRDSMFYSKLTHNDTLQKSLQGISGLEAKQAVKAFTEMQEEDDRTVVVSCDDDTVVANIDEDKTIVENACASSFVEGLNSQNAQEKTRAKETQLKTEKLFPYTQYIGRGIDARSDVYSLGMTLYCLLTGKSASADFGAIISLEKAGAKVSEGFTSIINKMIALSPDARYQDGQEYLKAIRNCYKLERDYIIKRRKRRTVLAVTSLIMIILAMSVFGVAYRMRLNKNNQYFEMISEAQNARIQGQYDIAAEYISQAKALERDLIDAYEEEIYLYYESGEYDTCISIGEQYINAPLFLVKTEEDNKSYGNIFYLVANAFFEQENYSYAELYLEKALNYNNSNGMFYRDYAIVLGKLGRIEEAQAQLDKAIANNLSEESIYLAQGEIARVKGEYEEAQTYFEKTLDLTKDVQIKKRAVLLSVDVYKSMGEKGIQNEITMLEKYSKAFEGSLQLVLTECLADAYLRMASYEEINAALYYEKALESFQNLYQNGYVTWQIQENIAILQENLQQFEEAEITLLQMVEVYPKRYETYKRLAYLEADRQQYKDNQERDYNQMKIWYDKSVELYDEKQQDMEMDMLARMIEDLEGGGWFR